MSNAEHICVISGICQGKYALQALVMHDVAASRVAREMASEIAASFGTGFTKDELEIAIREALTLTLFSRGEVSKWKPDGYMDMGCTGRDPFVDRCIIFERAKDGSVQTTCVEDFNQDNGRWKTIVSEACEEEIFSPGVKYIPRDPGERFVCWRRPYLYLKAWIARTGPSDLEQEFFELVNKHRGPAYEDDNYGPEYITSIDYGGLERTTVFEMQFWLQEARTGSARTGRAVADGLRGEELLPALGWDYGAWMAVRPDIWPTPSTAQATVFIDANDQACESRLHPFPNLPNEMVIEILRHAPVASLAALSAVSRSSRRLTMALANDVISYRIHVGELRWLLPVSTVRGEVARAESVARLWCPRTSIEDNKLEPRSPFDSPVFPFHDFVRTCLGSSMSMMNRRRLWNIAKQYERLGQESGIWSRHSKAAQ